jgi:hypothetical protein
MTHRERFIQTLTFGNPDKIPLQPGGPRESTLRAWHTQGLPEGKNYTEALWDELGLAPEPKTLTVSPGVSFRMMPEFEEQVLTHENGHYIVRDWMGAITEISDEFDVTYIRNARDFVTRKWHKFPVETREDWQEMKKRFCVDTTGRFPEDFDERASFLKNRDYVSGLNFNGPFWQLREWLGMENLCILFLDDPNFVGEMIEQWTCFVEDILLRATKTFVPDFVHMSEDMAYKAHPMISPALTREFLLPAYKRWIKILRNAGVPVIDMDSDGYVGDLIPIWIEAGINVCDPIEVAAGNDIVAFRNEYGNKMAYRGGIDKRAIAAGGKIMEAEVLRVVPPLLKDGGFIPSCDHGVPPDISWPNYVAYARLLAKLCGWL